MVRLFDCERNPLCQYADPILKFDVSFAFGEAFADVSDVRKVHPLNATEGGRHVVRLTGFEPQRKNSTRRQLFQQQTQFTSARLRLEVPSRQYYDRGASPFDGLTNGVLEFVAGSYGQIIENGGISPQHLR